MSRIPSARDELESIAELLEAYALDPAPIRKSEIMAVKKRIDAMIPMLGREKAIRKVPVHSASVTRDIVLRVKTMAKRNPRMSVEDIAAQFHIKGGRVSEILNGKKDHLL